MMMGWHGSPVCKVVITPAALTQDIGNRKPCGPRKQLLTTSASLFPLPLRWRKWTVEALIHVMLMNE